MACARFDADDDRKQHYGGAIVEKALALHYHSQAFGHSESFEERKG